MATESSIANLVKLWKASSELTVGEITRYRVFFDHKKLKKSTAWPPNNLVLKVTNTTPVIYRGAILAGPYNISATCVNTNHNCFTIPKQPTELIVPHTKSGIKCGETWKISLIIPDGEEWVGDWTIEVLSEIVFTCNKVQYDVSLFAEVADGALVTDEIRIANIHNKYNDDFTIIETFSPTITYEYFRPKDVFHLPDLTTINNISESSQNTKISVHLVVLTHGIHGSILDELYLREVIEEKCKHKLEHKVVVYMSDVNHSVTEDGIEKCGKRLAESILEYVGWPWICSSSTNSSSTSNGPLISNISFIGHSLGGLINIFLIGYLNSVTNGIFFKDIEPVHYIAIASPLLGSTDLAWYIKIGLEWGVIGQTGKDLALIPRSKIAQESASDILEEQEDSPTTIDSLNEEPLLLSLSRPNSSSHIALKLFKTRTLYANVANDTTVSLKTSSLYFINHDDDFIKNHYSTTIIDHLRNLINAINPPETTKEYLIRSFSAESPILHDKLYTPNDISHITNTTGEEEDETFYNLPIDEQIARFWHKDMTWRKVLVNLEGGAHTHVIVRRKWINAPGWQVIDHLLNNHEF
ncbi:putative serine esterase-domain-containing protein [Glomus cerebriforme]|uniref:Putative serine esterase-domain-containing protein n=1 Tax=Glomus cerebriforme TaxID=658196 RepID=A0A397TJF6_9GLOM|nr:putative serine esterase-domain-containing protein [Glomus cerebriforme]